MVRITLGMHSTVMAAGLTPAVLPDLSAKVVGAHTVAGFFWRELAPLPTPLFNPVLTLRYVDARWRAGAFCPSAQGFHRVISHRSANWGAAPIWCDREVMVI